MSLKAKFIWFIVIIHLVQIGLVITLYQYDKVIFVISEVVVVFSLLISILLYQSFLRPHRLLMAGVESLKDRDFSVKVKKVGQKDLDGLISLFNKMLDKLRNERIQLTERNFFLDKLIENSSSGIIILDWEQKVTNINPAAEQILGVSLKNAKGTPMLDLKSKLAEILVNIPLQKSKVIHLDGVKHYKCTKLSFHERGVERFFFHIDEVTDELIKAEKSSYEKIIRIMAHEVNNTLGAMNSVFNSALRFEDKISEAVSPKLVEAMKSSRERNNYLGTFMKNYADIVKLPQPSKEPCDLKNIAHRLKLLHEHQLEERQIEWHEDLPDSSVMISIDPAQIELVLTNIVKNALEAILQEGWIKVSLTSNSLSISNNGAPITPEQQQKIFDAFYTSKPNGQGIGLMLTKEILLNHNFDFSLSTNDDGVTVFEVIFK